MNDEDTSDRAQRVGTRLARVAQKQGRLAPSGEFG
jgi:hypothetical protein